MMKTKLIAIIMLLFSAQVALAEYRCFEDNSGQKWCGEISRAVDRPAPVIIQERSDFDKAVGTVFVGALTAAIVYTAIKDKPHYRPSYHTTHVVHEYRRPRWDNYHRRPKWHHGHHGYGCRGCR